MILLTVPAGASGLTIGTTTITGGSFGDTLYNLAGVVSGFTGQTKTAGALSAQTITEAVGASALTLTGATQVGSFPLITGAQTWNNAAVIFTGIKLNITDTASDAASLLLSLQVAGGNILSVEKSGVTRWPTADNRYIYAGGQRILMGATSGTFIVEHAGNGNSYLDARSTYLQGNVALILTSAFGAGSAVRLKTSATDVAQIRKSDDSALGTIQGVIRVDNNAVTGLVAGALAALTTATITFQDATGTVYRVPCITP